MTSYDFFNKISAMWNKMVVWTILYEVKRETMTVIFVLQIVS